MSEMCSCEHRLKEVYILSAKTKRKYTKGLKRGYTDDAANKRSRPSRRPHSPARVFSAVYPSPMHN
jgi:hypothetical protein